MWSKVKDPYPGKSLGERLRLEWQGLKDFVTKSPPFGQLGEDIKEMLGIYTQADKERATKILRANEGKTFVQRLLHPEEYPILPRPDLGPNDYSTHLMSWGTVGKEKKPIAYPEVIYNQRSGKLQMLSPKSAMAHARETGQYIPFPTEKEADWFSRRYKAAWKK